jgi:hypothetical protein
VTQVYLRLEPVLPWIILRERLQVLVHFVTPSYNPRARNAAISLAVRVGNDLNGRVPAGILVIE